MEVLENNKSRLTERVTLHSLLKFIKDNTQKFQPKEELVDGDDDTQKVNKDTPKVNKDTKKPFEEKLVDDMLINLNGVIKYNKEREEKERLFESKVSELKQIFDKQNLENLKNLSFELTEKKLSLDNELTESE